MAGFLGQYKVFHLLICKPLQWPLVKQMPPVAHAVTIWLWRPCARQRFHPKIETPCPALGAGSRAKYSTWA